MAESCTTLSRKRPIGGHVPSISKTRPDHAVSFAVDPLLSMENDRTKMYGSGGTSGSASGAVGVD